MNKTIDNLIDTTSKKNMKQYVKDNGFFFNMKANKFDTLNDALKNFGTNAFSTGVEVPTNVDGNIIIFSGLASQAYGKGEKSRNGYKIDPNGWDFTNYGFNPIILLQHNDDLGGIGHAIKFEVTAEGLNILFYVDLNTLDAKTAYQVKNGFINAISTGHITKSDGIEEVETGIVYTIGDAIEKFGIDNVWDAFCGESEMFTYIVTKAEAVENSLVTIGSNEKAMATQNAIGGYVKNKYGNSLEELKKNYVA